MLNVRSRERSTDLTLSIVMPAFNEERTIESALRRVLAVDYPCPTEVIVVDDGSTDATLALLSGVDDHRVRVESHRSNRGKGAAVRTGMSVAGGSHVLIFDADLEYDPGDVPALLSPVLKKRADVVYGSRIHGVHTAYQSLHYAMGSRVTTWFANIIFNSFLKDLHTCLKLLPLDLVRQLDLRESGFGLDTEITAKILRMGIRPYEVPVSYYSRSRLEGKKIRWQDGVECMNILMRVRRRPAPSARSYPSLVPRTATAGTTAVAAPIPVIPSQNPPASVERLAQQVGESVA